MAGISAFLCQSSWVQLYPFSTNHLKASLGSGSRVDVQSPQLVRSTHDSTGFTGQFATSTQINATNLLGQDSKNDKHVFLR